MEALTKDIAVALGSRWRVVTDGPEDSPRWLLLRDDGLRLRVAPFWRDARRTVAGVVWQPGELDQLPRQDRPTSGISMAATKTPEQMAREIVRRIIVPLEPALVAVRDGMVRQAALAAANATLADKVIRIISGRRSTNQSERDLQRGANIEIWPGTTFPAYRIEVGGEQIRLKDVTLPATQAGFTLLKDLAKLGRAA